MTIVGFTFTKMSAERKGAAHGRLNINNKSGILTVEKVPLALGTGSPTPALKFTFEFKTIYEPSIGEIALNGEIVYMDKPESIDAVIKDWTTNKHLPAALHAHIMNSVLSRCSVESLLMSKELNLPSPIQLPRIRKLAPGQVPGNPAPTRAPVAPADTKKKK